MSKPESAKCHWCNKEGASYTTARIASDPIEGQMAYPVDHAWYLCRPCQERLVDQVEAATRYAQYLVERGRS